MNHTPIDQHEYLKCGGCGRMFHPLVFSEREAYFSHDCNEDDTED